MDIEEKRSIIRNYCLSNRDCEKCVLACDVWEHCVKPGVGLGRCLSVKSANEEELNRAIRLIYEENTETENDAVNHPSHYCQEGSMECIDEMILLFGAAETMSFCKLNAWKYRKRALYKNGEEDMKKSDWYLAKYKELSSLYLV